VPVFHTENPFATEGRWLKGALHTHTTESDGHRTPAELATLYRDLGYDFLFFTDHGKVTRLEETVAGILTLPGIELGFGGDAERYWHMVGLDVDASVPVPEKFASPEALCEHVRATSAFSILAHPYWSQLSGKDLTRLDAIDAVEVWNTGCELEIGRGAAEYQWDWCLGTGRRVSAVAVDDCHSRIDDSGGGWVMVKAPACTREAILDALLRGRFYSACGPEIRDLRVTDEGIDVETTPCRSIGFLADRQTGARVLPEDGGTLTSASYRFRGKEAYVRVQMTDALGRTAWTNPFYLT